MRRRVVPFLVAAGVVSTAAFAQVPAGPEFRVNSYTTATQRYPAVTGLADGGFLVVWGSTGQDGSNEGVFGQRLRADGTPLGGEFRVNAYTTGGQGARSFAHLAAADRTGNFVVIWTDYDGHDGDATGVFGQRFDASGNRRGAEFMVGSYTNGYQVAGAVAATSGGFVVAWGDAARDGSGAGVFLQRYDANAAPLGGELLVNTYTTGFQFPPDLAVDAAGNFVVVWAGATDGDGDGILAQRFDATGGRRGGEFVVNAATAGSQHTPSVAVNADGSFAVAWQGYAGPTRAIWARTFDAAGSPSGSDFLVDFPSSGSDTYPRVAAADVDAFVVTWGNSSGDGSGYAVRAQLYSASGLPVGAQFQVNTYTTGDQGLPSVASNGSGGFVFAWPSAIQDGSGRGIYAQRLGAVQPGILAADAAGNGVLEPGESAVIAPSWRNVLGAPVSFGGLASGFTGPAGGTYTMTDGVAGYGTIPAGGSGGCGSDCYAVSVTAATRPVQHWDATFVEHLTPLSLAQARRWTLHLGDSFGDVPRTSGFYRFIETLLHYGITGGCGSTDYCPADSTTRAAMAVFVLVAKDGSGHTPPACVPPNAFADVPETSPFCRWIEELAARGVVSGCGGGNYCPDSPVTREQMSIFVLRTLDPTLNPPDCVPPNLFADVPETSAFCRWIEELARRGVVGGCGGGNYCPQQPVTREQMGVFISLTFGLTLYGP